MGTIKSVLFVCTGNSCRSVMAEGLLKKRLKELGRTDIIVSSAGMRAPADMPPTAETIEVMRQEGVDLSGFRSRNLTDEMIRSANLILVMEEAHKDEIKRKVPDAAGKIHLLKEFGASNKGFPDAMNIADPITRPMSEYRQCLETIEEEIGRIIKLL